MTLGRKKFIPFPRYSCLMGFEKTLKVKDLVLFNIIAMVGLRWIALSSREAGWSVLIL